MCARAEALPRAPWPVWRGVWLDDFRVRKRPLSEGREKGACGQTARSTAQAATSSEPRLEAAGRPAPQGRREGHRGAGRGPLGGTGATLTRPPAPPVELYGSAD